MDARAVGSGGCRVGGVTWNGSTVEDDLGALVPQWNEALLLPIDSAVEPRRNWSGERGLVQFRGGISPVISGSTVEVGTPGTGSTVETRIDPRLVRAAVDRVGQ
jgi:hypothetical protein